MNPFSNVCSDANQFRLAGGLPFGGTYSGAGIMNGMFSIRLLDQEHIQITYYFEDSIGCNTSSVQDITVDICTGITNIISDATVSLYPNPADSKINIDLNSDDKINSLELYNSSGAIVYRKTNFEIKSLKHFEIDLGLFSPGVYFLRLYSENGIINKKLMVE
ncbi:MAG: T9SS type A sorting domain-containing protein [Bacteroidetes bacterium]|nr:T9SS type A sorting domain-containing protein [Bacteroidota bacterium]